MSESGYEDGDTAGNSEDAEHDDGSLEQGAITAGLPPEECDAGGDYDQD